MTTPLRRDRRHGRRDESLAEIVEIAVQVIGEYGAAGLSLGEVARRMGMQTPSLYGYFSSKNALYDAVFSRGWRELLAALREQNQPVDAGTDLTECLGRLSGVFVRWSVEHPAYAELMLWRPVPGYHPSDEAYQPAVETLAESQALVVALQAAGLLTSAVPAERLLAAWTVLVTGVVTQQLANAPGESFAEGSFTALLPDVVAMYVRQYSPPGTDRPTPGTPR